MSNEQLANIFAFTAFMQGWMITHVIQKNTKAGSPPKKGWKLLKAVSKYMYMLPDFGTTVLSSTNGKQSKNKTTVLLREIYKSIVNIIGNAV